MSTIDYQKKAVRSSLILTTSYVAGTILENINDQNQLIILADFTIGSLTTAEIKVEFATARRYDLAYDGQSANFTVGEIVRGASTGAYGTVLADTDGGTSGTLLLGNVKGTFLDNEVLTGTVTGVAVANGTLTDNSDWYQETASSVSGGTSSDSVIEHAFDATGKFRIAVPINDRHVKISSKGTGTVTGSLMKVDALVGVV